LSDLTIRAVWSPERYVDVHVEVVAGHAADVEDLTFDAAGAALNLVDGPEIDGPALIDLNRLRVFLRQLTQAAPSQAAIDAWCVDYREPVLLSLLGVVGPVSPTPVVFTVV
jgi:hypothetical protein